MKRGLIAAVFVCVLAAAGLGAARPDAATRPRCLGAVATKVGTKFSDVLRGTPRNDVIVGLGGADIIIAGAGNDRICGGPGHDRVDGGPGSNRCEAEIRLRCGPESARIVSATASEGSRLELVADRTLRGTAPTDGFGVTVNGAPVAVREAARSGRRVVLSLGTPAFSDDRMSVTIRQTARRELRVRTGTIAVANRNPVGCSFLAGTPADDQVSEGPTNPALFPSARGGLRAIFLSVDFPDATAGTRPVADGDALADWADDISYGRFALAADKGDHWFRMPDNSASYGLARHPGATTFPSFVTTALSLADPSVDFSRYDAVFLLGTPPELPETAFTVPRGRGVVLDGVEVRFVAVGSAPSPGSLNRTPESLGRLLGLPHLDPTFVGWDPMHEGVRSFTAWHKRKLGWVDPEQVRCVQRGTMEVQVSPMVDGGGTKAVIVPTGPTTGLVVENRYPLGYDASSCLPGALVYAVEPTTLRLQPAGGSSDCAALFGIEAGQQASYQDTRAEVTVLAERDRDLLIRVTRR
jgi:hypothetical protein